MENYVYKIAKKSGYFIYIVNNMLINPNIYSCRNKRDAEIPKYNILVQVS